ncbi:NAD-dependent epimerase/dehydratase family protein [Peribacillus asahii]|uniref:NAD-dependent epimerase/dehydratase family protein n=1 Tax=Peribacillus asahii TaxID=228899 RepID=UPI0037FEAF96
MKCLVTGGAGFIGSHIVDELLAQNFEVIVIDNLSTGNISNLSDKVKFYNMDILDSDVQQVFSKEKPDYVIHHAAQVSVPFSMNNPLNDAEININGTINLLEEAVKNNVSKFIFASSAAVYGFPNQISIDENHNTKPISPYGMSKLTAENYIKMYSDIHGIDYTIFRYANVYGPRQDVKGEAGVVAIFVEKLLNNKKCTIFGDGKQTRDFIYVKDIATANVKALNSKSSSKQVLNLGLNERTSIIELFNIIREFTSNSSHSPIYSDCRSGDIKHSCLSNIEAKNVLNWLPQYDVDKGLQETVRFFEEMKTLMKL